MAFNTIQINPAISSKAIVHAAVAVGDAMDDAASSVITLTFNETNFGLSYGIPQIFKATVVWTVGKEPNVNVAGRLGNFLAAIQSIVQALGDAPAGTLYLGPRP